MSDTTLIDARNLAGRMRQWRRHLHAHPELSGEEHATARFLAQELTAMGYTPAERVGGTCGLTADLPVDGAPLVALRADMDALPIQEETGLPFASQRPGVMHACGHDAHMAMLLGVASILRQRRDRLRQGVRLIFQPAEEKLPGGAAALVDAGVLDGVSGIFGLHVWSPLPAGTLGLRAGPFMASVDDFHITVRGKGGHAALPETCIDPVVAAAQIVVGLQTAVSRSIALTDGAVVSVTRLEAGTATNIIPETAGLAGTIRTLDEAVRARARVRVRELAERIAHAHRAEAEVRIEPGYPVLVNDETMVARVEAAARRLGWDDDRLVTMPPLGGGEDFAYYARRIPAAFAFLGAAQADAESCHPHHHPRFDIDEDVLPLGAALLAELALSAS